MVALNRRIRVFFAVILAVAGCQSTSTESQSESNGAVHLANAPSKSNAFDPARLETLHATTKRFVDEGKHAGIITLLVHDGRVADFAAYGYRDLEKRLPMQRDTICRMYSMSKIITSAAT